MPPVDYARLRDRRDELDLSNADLAALVSTTEGYIVNIMCGSDEPSNRMIYRLARALRLEARDIGATGLSQSDPGDGSEDKQTERERDPSGPPGRKNGDDDRRGPKRTAAVRRSA